MRGLVACSVLLAGCELLAPFPDPPASSAAEPPGVGGDGGPTGDRFREPMRLGLATSAPIHSISVADVDLDGHLDLVVTTENDLIVQSGADGTFEAPPRSLPVAAPLVRTVIADVSGDLRPDLVAASAQQLAVFPGQPDGTFAPPTTIDLDSTTLISSIAAGQLIGDARTDLVVGANDGVWLLRGSDEGFIPGQQTQYGDVVGVVLADVAPAPGVEEIVIEPRRISIAGVSHFNELLFDRTISDLVAADLDGDQNPELIVGSNDAIEVVHQADDTRTQIALGGRRDGLAAGDFDGDGDQDIATTTGGDLMMLWNDHGELTAEVVLTGLGPGVTTIGAERIDTDNRADIVLGIASDVAILLTAP
ncbi:MAG: FG-GAP repeat domain-containing protein [Kofleriaceae bacterium]